MTATTESAVRRETTQLEIHFDKHKIVILHQIGRKYGVNWKLQHQQPQHRTNKPQVLEMHSDYTPNQTDKRDKRLIVSTKMC